MDPDFSDITEKKVKPSTLILIIIILGVILGFLGYFVYENFFSENKDEYIRDEDQDILNIGIRDRNLLLERLEDYLFFANYFPVSNISVISNQDILRFAISRLELNHNDLTRSNVEVIVNIYFADTFDLVFTDIISPTTSEVLYEFDETTETFTRVVNNNQDITHRAEFEFISGTSQGNTYIMVLQMMFFAPCINNCGALTAVYQTPQDAHNDTNRVINIAGNTISGNERARALEDVVETTIVFRRVNNNFILQSMDMNFEVEIRDIPDLINEVN